MPLGRRRRMRRRRVAGAAVASSVIADNEAEQQEEQYYDAPPEEYTAPTEQESEPDMVDKLKELGELHASGVLTDEEFTAGKAKLLES